MNAFTPLVFHPKLPFAIVFFCLVCTISLRAQSLPECSLSKTNESCAVVIDRSNPVAPSTVQMYSDQQLTVIIRNPLPFERYFLDFTTGQATLSPDVASTIVQELVPSLNHLQVVTSHAVVGAGKPTKGCDDPHFTEAGTWPAAGAVATAMPVFYGCFAALATQAIQTYSELEPLVAPDSLTQQQPAAEPYYYRHNRCRILADTASYINAEAVLSTRISAVSDDKTTKYSPADEDQITHLGEFQKLTDAIAADLAGYTQRIIDLGSEGFGEQYAEGTDTSDNACSWSPTGKFIVGSQVLYNGKYYISRTNNQNSTPDTNASDWQAIETPDAVFQGPYDSKAAYNPGSQVTDQDGHYWTCISGCTGSGPAAPSWIPSPVSEQQSLPDVVISSRQDNEHIYDNMVTRAIAYSFDTLDLVSYSQQAAPSATNKKTLAPIVINFADRPNTHLGRPFTALRWEASAGVFFSWLPNRTFTLLSGALQDSKSRPTAVPFAAANYRLTGDLGSRWKQNFYFTGAAGINPNNTEAEFGVGPSYSWRALMVSAFCHFGHDAKLAPGALSSTASTLPTVWHWTETGAIGISVRVPSLAGR